MRHDARCEWLDSSLSHSTESWDVRNLQIMMFDAIKWSLGLTDAPVQPHPKREQGPTTATLK